MTAFVVDASVAVKWVVDEDDSEAAARLSEYRLAAPDLLLTESANALWAKARRGELSPEEAEERMETLGTAPVELISPRELLSEAVRLAFELDHPVYDCLYLALATDREIQVITADRRFYEAVSRHAEHRDGIRLLSDFTPEAEQHEAEPPEDSETSAAAVDNATPADPESPRSQGG